ncbi:MAG: hypothetical protein HC831_15520 [Chloroflexia bacterium]|nr:hypothetical protein [Chloroflexia bacterium]
MKIVGKDFKGNAVSLNFKVLSDSTKAIERPLPGSSFVKKIDCFKEDTFATDSFQIIFHKNCLYHNIELTYFTSGNKYSNFSKLHHIHNSYIPIHNKVSILIKPDNLPKDLKNKALIAGLTTKGNIYAVSSEWKDNFLEAKVSSFGTYFIAIDSLKPVIRSLSIDKYNRVKSGQLKFKITDNLSGVEEYIGYINNKWVLFEYDQKNNQIECNLSKEGIKMGKHSLVLWVKDYCGNIASYETSFNFM